MGVWTLEKYLQQMSRKQMCHSLISWKAEIEFDESIKDASTHTWSKFASVEAHSFLRM